MNVLGIVARALAAALLPTGFALAAEPPGSTDWPLLGNSPEMQHHSDLDQINTETVARLGLVWSVDLPTLDGLVGNPLIKDGRIFQSGSQSKVFAHDLRTGELLWTHEPLKSARSGSIDEALGMRINRGVALYDDLAIVATADCRLVAVDQATGVQRWEAEACDAAQGYSITGAPRVGAGKAFIGNACQDSGSNRGHVNAFDAGTGEHLWRFYTVPGDPDQPPENELYLRAMATWGEGWYERTKGCGSVWDAMVYDAQTNQLIIGTGGPAPLNPTMRGKGAGDELFTNALVALDADTGDYRWHFSQVPGDGWNWEPAVGLMLATLPVFGEDRRVVVSVPKNGFVYLFDAASGEFLSAKNYVPVTWAKGLDEFGRPIFDPSARYWEQGDGVTRLVPTGGLGAHGWEALALNPRRHLLYIPVMNIPTAMSRNDGGAGFSFDFYYGDPSDPSWRRFGEVVAWDLITQSEVWRRSSGLPVNGGLLHTSGGLVFQGSAEGYLTAYDAASGEPRWGAPAGGAIRAAPSTVMVEGRQFVIVPAGRPTGSMTSTGLGHYSSTPRARSQPRLLAFALDGEAEPPAWAEPTRIPKPTVARMDPELAGDGALVYESYGCMICHGKYAAGLGGTAPDLRVKLPASLEYLQAVLDGALKSTGMPAYGVDERTAEALLAYQVNAAWDAYEAQQHGNDMEETPAPEESR
ncbi:MAG: PQQ-binding-like beta-propeller repeat protein [Gammaproteobacteria bacterium]|nr:PQQ-binding-like beta-propeller repeat protein [Gammaproteobacteria bacterium]